MDTGVAVVTEKMFCILHAVGRRSDVVRTVVLIRPVLAVSVSVTDLTEVHTLTCQLTLPLGRVAANAVQAHLLLLVLPLLAVGHGVTHPGGPDTVPVVTLELVVRTAHHRRRAGRVMRVNRGGDSVVTTAGLVTAVVTVRDSFMWRISTVGC